MQSAELAPLYDAFTYLAAQQAEREYQERLTEQISKKRK
jgi:hypothetical protein